MALGASHKFAAVARSRKVGILVRLRALFTAAHLPLVEGVARSDGVLISGHSHAHFLLVEQWAPHCLLSLLAGRRCVDHLLRLKQELVDSACAVNRGPATHPVHVVRLDWHLLRVDELIDHGLARGWLTKPAVIRPLRVVSHHHLLSRGSRSELRLDLATA